MTDSPISCDLLISGGIILTLDADRRILWDGAIAVNGGTLQFTDSTSLAGATMNSGGLFKTGVSTLHLGNGTLNIIQGTLLIDPIIQPLPEAPATDPAVITAPEETIVETTPTDSTPPADQTTAPETVAEEPAATDPLA